jgi:uncharacterized membrane protein YccC
MSTAHILDFTRPESAKAVGGDLAASTEALTTRLTRSLAVTDVPSLEQAVLDRQSLGDAIKRVQEFFAPLKQMADRLHKAICAREHEVLAPLQRVDGLKRVAIGEFKQAQDRIRAQRERELAEQRRREDEARAAAEAAELEAAGDRDQAAAVMDEAIAAPPPVVVLPDAMKAIEGLKFRTEYKWRFTTDEARALQLLPREFLSVDPRKLTAYAKAMKGAGKVPGVVFYSEQLPVR